MHVFVMHVFVIFVMHIVVMHIVVMHVKMSLLTFPCTCRGMARMAIPASCSEWPFWPLETVSPESKVLSINWPKVTKRV